MSLRFQCPKCQSNLTVGEKFAGRRGKCPNCKARIQVPGPHFSGSIGGHGDQKDAGEGDKQPPGAVEQGLPNIVKVEVPDGGIQVGEQATGDSEGRQADAAFDPRQTVSVPRWVVYFHGALLGLTATTFFIFGMAAGSQTSPGGAKNVDGPCIVSGAVYYDRQRERLADRGAVILMVPVDAVPVDRPDPTGLRPQKFNAIRNPAIDEIRALGGAVARADQDGKFEIELDGDQSYWLLVISKHRLYESGEISKQTRAEMGTFFLPVEDLLGDRDFLWNKVRIGGARHRIPDVTF